MTTVTLPTATFAAVLPHPGRYAVAPDRSLAELTAWYGPLPTHRRRVTLTDATLTVPDDPTVPEHPAPTLRFEFEDLDRTDDTPTVLTSDTIELLDGGRKLQLTGDLNLRGVRFPALLRLRVVERADHRLLVVGTALLPYRLLRRATGFRPSRLPRPATRLRLLVAAEFA
ncbi:hypothetical protein ADL01_33150 [Streptomyces sp. NRRL WC-3618]|uniref:hypothetical protein n=1 Tax=Streptomyces sp. NRRL WC-3618 TaxID=1519490 RepID=UPI0006AD9CD8|nr:hypothetical protein [Streptomyces sp. NRRL WC-3618]KOV60328.1 hypothetical protein ADL01_33150 [Streptomyces sp. NRRL WC-3618]